MVEAAPTRANGSRLEAMARLAVEADAAHLAAEAEALSERVRDGRFYVACVGQFKRGKSTLINALVGERVLPTGVVPVTAVVTIVRHGERTAARIRLTSGGWQEIPPAGLAQFVAEERNPENRKGVAAVEVLVPSPLLATGMCLVDTPGIGSVFVSNAARIRDDFNDRVLESRRRFLSEIRAAMAEAVSSSERALARAKERHAQGSEAVRAEVERIDNLSERLGALGTERKVGIP